jgi:hypothetical protein
MTTTTLQPITSDLRNDLDPKENSMTTTTLQPITADEILSVYNGKARACCCGCKGTHSYPSSPTARLMAGKRRGYEINDNEVNDRKIAFVIRTLNANLEDVEDGGSFYCYETPTRMYVAYKVFGN